jgi:hypothetical protein
MDPCLICLGIVIRRRAYLPVVSCRRLSPFTGRQQMGPSGRRRWSPDSGTYAQRHTEYLPSATRNEPMPNGLLASPSTGATGVASSAGSEVPARELLDRDCEPAVKFTPEDWTRIAQASDRTQVTRAAQVT